MTPLEEVRLLRGPSTTAQVCAMLRAAIDELVNELRASGSDIVSLSVLVDMQQSAAAWRRRQRSASASLPLLASAASAPSLSKRVQLRGIAADPVTSKEAAAIAGCSERWIRELAGAEQLPGSRIGSAGWTHARNEVIELARRRGR